MSGHKEVLYGLIEKNPFEKGFFPQTPFLKLQYLKYLSPAVRGIGIFILKSLEGGSGDNLSSERFRPDKFI